ncbi:MAG: hypothetical protein R2755_13310 [Acidimicrobiales bacterium]
MGTAIAGVLIATVGATLCLYLNAVSFLAVVVAMQLMRRPVQRGGPLTARQGPDPSGLRYALGHPEVRCRWRPWPSSGRWRSTSR